MIKRNKVLILLVVLVLIIVTLYRLNDTKNTMEISEQQVISFDQQSKVVAVLDTGIDFDRVLLKDKKLAEYCFSETREQIQSLCTSSNTGKNVLGGGKQCSSDLDFYCGHGTFVAGILAQLVPEVQIVSYQVYSKLGKEIVLTHNNYLSAMDDIIHKKQNKIINFDTVNISWNYDEFYVDKCDNYKPEMTSKVKKLLDLGIKTYVSTGNNSQKNKLAYPACITGVIPVGSKEADGQVSNYANSNNFVKTFGQSKIKSIYPKSDALVESYGTSFSVTQAIAVELNK